MAKYESGDTIVEVLLAIAVFSAVAVATLILMHRGVLLAQQSLEVTLVRQQIDAQADLLRYVHARAAAGDLPARGVWDGLPRRDGAAEQLLGIDVCPETFPSNGFALRVRGGEVASDLIYRSPAVYARTVDAESHGVSVQLTKAQGANAEDAYIQACWYPPGRSRPVTIGTIVRLYEPKR